jgi:hypothetical protein
MKDLSHRRAAIMLILALAVISTAIAIGAQGASKRVLTTNTPGAELPYIYQHYGKGKAVIWHSGDCDNVQYTIRLSTAGGVVLTQKSGTIYSVCGDIGNIVTSEVYCGGRSVHSFLYINYDGIGKSDTSGNLPC